MSSDIYEEIAARHLQLDPTVFVRTSHNPGDKSWIAEIDVMALDFGRKIIILVEVKSGNIGKFDQRAAQYENEIIPRLRVQLEEINSIFSDWKIERRLYVKSSFQKAAESLVGSVWNVLNLDDAFNALLRN